MSEEMEKMSEKMEKMSEKMEKMSEEMEKMVAREKSLQEQLDLRSQIGSNIYWKLLKNKIY
jgi:hypothetical protein